MPTGAAIAGGAVLRSQASRRAGKAAGGAAEEAARGILTAGEAARRDVLDIFPLAQRDLLAGASGAFDIFGQGIQGQQQALGQGNLNAQQTVALGLPQVQAALLGTQAPQSGAFAPQGVQLGQLPTNPFTAAGGLGVGPGGLGAPGTFNTGQGNFADVAGVSRNLNPFAASLDRAGFLQRDPSTGRPGIDFTGGQAPGSAAGRAPGGSTSLGRFAFERALLDQRQQEQRALGGL